MIVCAYHDGIQIPCEDLRRIPDFLPTPHLDLIGGEVYRMSAQLGNRHLKGQPCPCGLLFEQETQVLPFEGVVLNPALLHGLQLLSPDEQGLYLLCGEVTYGQEISFHLLVRNTRKDFRQDVYQGVYVNRIYI